MSVRSYSVIASVPVILALVASGCATKKYVKTQTDQVNQRVSQLQAQTKDQLAKGQAALSRLDERLTTTNNNLAAVASTAQQANTSAAQANASAAQANERAQANSTQISTNSADITKLEQAQNYTLVETGNVTFGFNKSDLTSEAKAALDVMVQKATAQPRTVLEITGFTDEIGPQSYNLALSRRRADSVARYLVKQNVPLKGISVIGLGEEQTPEQLAAEVQAVDPNASKKDLRTLARRVRIRLYAPGGSESTSTTGGGSAQLHQ